MTRSLLEVPNGVQCFVGAEARLRRVVERVLVDVFRGWSYEEVVLPLFDFDEVFGRGGGPTDEGGTYRFIGRDGDVMALRPDFTALVAKVVVSRLSGRELPLRLFYSGEVLRYQPPQAGQQEELFQVGLEHLGDGLEADVEVLLIALEALSALGIPDVRLTLGHVGFVLGLLESAEASESERAVALEVMRRRDVSALNRLLGAERARALVESTRLSGRAGGDVISEAARFAKNEASARAIEHLRAITKLIEGLGLGEHLLLDFGEVRGFDYYTGLVFEAHAPGAGLELGGGGRYDSLLARFGQDVPAVGFYLSLDRLAELVDASVLDPPTPARETIQLRDDAQGGFRSALAARRERRVVRLAKE